MTMRTQNAGTPKMIESPDRKIRYEFFTRPVKESNVSNKIAYYEPIVRFCQKLTGGSTYFDCATSVERGNEFFKECLAKGYSLVTERSFV